MPRLDAYEAWIECEGTKLKEYKIDGAGNTRHCWVASESGKVAARCIHATWSQHLMNQYFAQNFIFAVRTSVKANENVAVSVTFDGIDTKQLWLLKTEHRVSRIRGINLSKNEIKEFIFSTIELTDDEDAGNIFRPSDIGTMSVKFLKVLVEQREAVPTLPASIENGPICERWKKAGVHRVCLSDGSTFFPEGYCHKVHSITTLDNEPPLAIIHFKYRPQEVLRADGIITTDVQLKEEQYAPLYDTKERFSLPAVETEGADIPPIKSEEYHVTPSSIGYKRSLSPFISVRNRNHKHMVTDPRKRVKDLITEPRVQTSARPISIPSRNRKLKEEEDELNEFNELNEDDNDLLRQLKARRDELDRKIECLRYSKSSTRPGSLISEVKLEPIVNHAVYHPLVVDANGVIDLTVD
ncbi:hypothetical protein EW145_g1959 [Phellinidium pouzarii]|uniref:DUF7918 domain-containing protein n=1 Tax=Phellinidium pouzarii TaxID=167371 RepID=A0A4S4LCK5_9AGAM|nr:hypothetical protein EW145_g1959 [Phellinidium pouzarii]